jgi:hypothetical protein
MCISYLLKPFSKILHYQLNLFNSPRISPTIFIGVLGVAGWNVWGDAVCMPKYINSFSYLFVFFFFWGGGGG